MDVYRLNGTSWGLIGSVPAIPFIPLPYSLDSAVVGGTVIVTTAVSAPLVINGSSVQEYDTYKEQSGSLQTAHLVTFTTDLVGQPSPVIGDIISLYTSPTDNTKGQILNILSRQGSVVEAVVVFMDIPSSATYIEVVYDVGGGTYRARG